MAVQATEYRKLPGRGGRSGCASLVVRLRARLWMGRDHLLCVYNTGYAEDYKRFYYRDIQAIVCSKTDHGRNLNIAYAVIAGICCLLSLPVSPAVRPVFWAAAAMFLLFLLINALLGPTAACYLRTAVSREDLPSLGRMRNAMKALDMLRPVIEREQGRLSSADLREKMETVPAERRHAETASSPHRPARSRKEIYYGGKAHAVFLSLLVSDGLITLVQIFGNNFVLTIVSLIFTLGVAIGCIVALIKQQDSRMQGWLRATPWVTLVYLWVSQISGYFIGVMMGIKNPEKAASQWEWIRYATSISALDSMPHLIIYSFSVLFSCIVGISGLLVLIRYRRETAGSSAGPGN